MWHNPAINNVEIKGDSEALQVQIMVCVVHREGRDSSVFEFMSLDGRLTNHKRHSDVSAW